MIPTIVLTVFITLSSLRRDQIGRMLWVSRYSQMEWKQ